MAHLGERRVFNRLDAETELTVHLDGDEFRVLVHDVSPGGVMVDWPAGPAPSEGTHIKVSVPDTDLKANAVIARSGEAGVGLSFDSCPSGAVIAAWLRARGG